mgnify:CR=1 FL=1
MYKEGSEPYEGIEFERKHVKITNKENEIIFEDYIQFPKDFDDNAAAIVASRYLCNSAKHKETSIRDMFDRVSDTISEYGLKDKYYDNEKEFINFNHRLKYYQIHKYFAFNSPVYFNVGLQEKPQTSACFILNMDDNMDSITEVSKLEAQIFKKGSGSGTNLSKLRSSREPVGGGGKASGPISFLKAHDTLAGVVKSGGTLRRSAKLACLNIDHPDIEDFIDCKLYEEEKLAILRKAGLKARPGYDLSDEVYFQNTNLSVRVSNSFMEKVINNGEWKTTFILQQTSTSNDCKIYKARNLLKKIAETSWKIGDPGLQFHDTFNDWNTLANDGQIESTNPCGEFASLNDTSCNLASINLIKFFIKNTNNTFDFDFDTFVDVIKTVITAQDILIDNSIYPSDEITKNTRAYRNLGLGYTNLGALLMWMGISYDSDEARFLASQLTALMTGIAYDTSASIAEKVGEFEKFNNNKTSLLRVLKKHHNALYNTQVIDVESCQRWYALRYLSTALWDKIIKYEKFRNAQVTLLAPTGTISSVMNAITTGVEPEFSLIRYKRLTGSEGAILKYVNPIVEESLKNIGYSETVIPNIIKELIGEEVENTNFKDQKDRNIFLTAAPTPGTKLCIPYMGHVKMCAAIQPFLSGAISKTINLPQDVTVDEIFNLYIEAWKMGLKGITIYRDSSKNFQPLSTTVDKKEEIKNIPVEIPKLVRKKLPAERKALTHKFKMGSSDGYITCGFYPDTNELGEIFVNVSKEGSTISGFADALATVLSIALQYGVPLKEYVRKLSHLKFEPSGFTSNPDIRTASSIVDYIARYLGLKFLPEKEQIELGLISSIKDKTEMTEKESTKISSYDQDIGPTCPNCGTIMRRLGSCYFCSNCSYNQGSCG